MFYFWNVNHLVQDLRAGVVTEFDKMRYLLATILVQFLGVSSAAKFVPTNNYEVLLKALFFGVAVGITIWGVQHCYLINKHNDNKNFLERFICLSFPVVVRLLIFSLLGLFIALVLVTFGLVLFGDTIPRQLESYSGIINAVKQGQSVQVMATSPALRQGLLRLHVINFIFSSVISVIYFLILGKKIGEVGRTNV